MKQAPSLPPATRSKLEAFSDLLGHWNSRVNLIADAAPKHLWQRHILDSLQIVEYLPKTTGLIIDIGSGGGFPGLVIAIAEPQRAIHLVESDKRKAAFLSNAAQTLALSNVSVTARRIEDTDLLADVITARAVASVARLLDLVAPRLLPGGIAILPKGKSVEDELTTALSRWTLRVERFRSCTDEHGVILRLSEIARIDRTT